MLNFEISGTPRALGWDAQNVKASRLRTTVLKWLQRLYQSITKM